MPLDSSIQVLIVDDHALVREGLRSVINRQADMQVCGEAEDAAGALHLVRHLQPDVAVVDLTLPDGSGLKLIGDLQAIHPALRVLVSSMHDESLFVDRALQLGARGYVHKQEGTERIVTAIRCIRNGELFLSERLSHSLLRQAPESSAAPPRSKLESLTNRELEVFEKLGQGQSAREIAESLRLSPKTIDRYRENIKHKLGLESANEVLRHATQWVLQAGDGQTQ
jgi:DNA-binding NarL/FixJ family response regulator